MSAQEIVIKLESPEPSELEVLCPKWGGKRQVIKSRACPDAGNCVVKKVIGYEANPCTPQVKDVPVYSEPFDQTSEFCGAATFLACGACHTSEKYIPKAASP